MSSCNPRNGLMKMFRCDKAYLSKALFWIHAAKFITTVLLLFPYANFYFAGLTNFNQLTAQLLILISIVWRILVRFLLVLLLAIFTSCRLAYLVETADNAPLGPDMALSFLLHLFFLFVTQRIQPAIYSVTVLPWMPGSPWLHHKLEEMETFWLWLKEAASEAPGLVIRFLYNVVGLVLYFLCMDWVTDILKWVQFFTQPQPKPKRIYNICYRKFARGVDEFSGDI